MKSLIQGHQLLSDGAGMGSQSGPEDMLVIITFSCCYMSQRASDISLLKLQLYLLVNSSGEARRVFPILQTKVRSIVYSVPKLHWHSGLKRKQINHLLTAATIKACILVKPRADEKKYISSNSSSTSFNNNVFKWLKYKTGKYQLKMPHQSRNKEPNFLQHTVDAAIRKLSAADSKLLRALTSVMGTRAAEGYKNKSPSLGGSLFHSASMARRDALRASCCWKEISCGRAHSSLLKNCVWLACSEVMLMRLGWTRRKCIKSNLPFKAGL